MSERALFVGAAGQKRTTFTSLCAAFDISPKTGYKWVSQFELAGVKGLGDRSRRPLSNSRAIRPEIVEHFVRLRRLHPTWGPQKLMTLVEAEKPGWDLPAASTLSNLFKRRGLIKEPLEKKRHQGSVARSTPLRHATAPNVVWSMDFKGWVRLGDGSRCGPLTVTDNFSRFLLCCESAGNQKEAPVWASLVRVFREFGMPIALRFDNGQPWVAPKGGLHLTKLSAKLLRLSIALEPISRGKPQENGRHERMHRTLLDDAMRPPAFTLRRQQNAFDNFKATFNEVRPHAALAQRTPASVYAPSGRIFPAVLPEPSYEPGFSQERIDAGGWMRLAGSRFFISTALAREIVGVCEIEDGCFEIRFCAERLGHVHRAHPELGIVPARP